MFDCFFDCQTGPSDPGQGARAGGGGNPPLDFGRSVNPWTWLEVPYINQNRVRYPPPSEFSDLPRALPHFYFDDEISAERSTNFHIVI